MASPISETMSASRNRRLCERQQDLLGLYSSTFPVLRPWHSGLQAQGRKEL